MATTLVDKSMLDRESGATFNRTFAVESLFGGGGLRGVEWLVPWHPVADNPADVASMELQLGRELAANHPLFGLPVRTLARRQDCDDVLFAIEDGTGRVAVVHLTWTGSPPECPPYPWTVVYSSFEAWVAGGMQTDAAEFGV